MHPSRYAGAQPSSTGRLAVDLARGLVGMVVKGFMTACALSRFRDRSDLQAWTHPTVQDSTYSFCPNLVQVLNVETGLGRGLGRVTIQMRLTRTFLSEAIGRNARARSQQEVVDAQPSCFHIATWGIVTSMNVSPWAA